MTRVSCLVECLEEEVYKKEEGAIVRLPGLRLVYYREP
jgi:hypothetical protein